MSTFGIPFHWTFKDVELVFWPKGFKFNEAFGTEIIRFHIFVQTLSSRINNYEYFLISLASQQKNNRLAYRTLYYNEKLSSQHVPSSSVRTCIFPLGDPTPRLLMPAIRISYQVYFFNPVKIPSDRLKKAVITEKFDFIFFDPRSSLCMTE